jgi:hypothetical protein
MKIFCDNHHHDLFYSLQLLFEKRFGWELYRPIGLDWYHEGYWNVYPSIDTAKQYLDFFKKPSTHKPQWGQLNKHYTSEDGIYYVTDVTKNKVQRGITLEKFKNMEFDILISSMPQHIQPFNKLISLYQPKAKHIFQVGNAWGQQAGVNNILASTSYFPTSNNINICYYHQEFDLDVFNYESKCRSNTISSFIHYMNRNLWDQYKNKISNMQFNAYGAGMDFCWSKTSDEAEQYKNSKWTWYFKPGGDGFGYSLFRSMATGTPMLIWGPHCQGKLSGELMIDGSTCIDLSKRTIDDNINFINYLSQTENHLQLQDNCCKKFKEKVNYEIEFEQIKKFIERLV